LLNLHDTGGARLMISGDTLIPQVTSQNLLCHYRAAAL
jgi:hypothetical protein